MRLSWSWPHKLRRAMVRPERELLSGVVELDQSVLGGRSHGRPGGASGAVADHHRRLRSL